MKKALFRKSIISALLLALLVFSTIASVTRPVQADPTGIGKFVEVKVEGGGGSVILTKLSSGETWNTTDYEDNVFIEKVGAGLVRLDAVADPNYVFDHWQITDVDNNVEEIYNQLWYEFRTEKGTTYVIAYFKEVFPTITITAFVSFDAPNGTISLTSGGVGNSSWVIPVEIGGNLELWFIPDEGNHTSAIVKRTLKNGVEYLAPIDILALFDIREDVTIEVFFSEDGYAWVPEGDNVEVYFTPSASLQFESTKGGDAASGVALVRPEEFAIILWDISTLATDGDGYVTIAFNLTQLTGGVKPTAVLRCDNISAFYCDVNNDNIVDAADLSLVAIANKATQTNPNGFEYNALYDTNRDGQITEEDVHFVNNYKGTEITWTPLDFWFNTPYDTIIYISTDHFSIFRAR